ncbi:MarR family transcriptional regulator [Pseudomonas hefeiensis]|uniref:MarR family transcriptional regulator n=1 Tax=Pseudomonas hefeiensis TaxID=2738125 RepID=A0ABY9GGP2_9PSED|nr:MULTISPECIES: MarR family transcriptional regulator [unclassified Pseudomonas]WLH14820.1 MarR family transcriptional regulator [Pseudomonas sp. FP205]WLH98514.1 MarR family transcriptional regulator [Pseudomonas sp. FP53]WLI42146.1 MarR family transcriptional regulator [Pseudomonas sp. FP821]
MTKSSPRMLMVANALKACYWFEDALRKNQEAHGIPTVTRSQAFLLANIVNGEHRATRLARLLGISRQAISKMLNDLVDQGVLETTPDPNDARAQLVVFTARHEPIQMATKSILFQLEEELEIKFGKEKLNIVRDVLAEDWGPAPLLEAIES